MNQVTLFDQEAGRVARDQGMTRVEANANTDWKQAAFEATELAARSQQYFTTDDLYPYLRDLGVDTHDWRALGPVMRRAAHAGLIVATDRTRNTVRPEAHCNPKRIWRSLVYRPEQSSLVM